MAHPAPALQKALSQKFRADQVTAGQAAGDAAAALFKHGFSIKEARSSWAAIRPAILTIMDHYYVASQEAGKAFYNTTRVASGAGVLPAKVKTPVLRLGKDQRDTLADSTGLGWFLHMVKEGSMMMDAFESAESRLQSAVAATVMGGARDWIEATARIDPDSEGTRRVPGGTCGYCDGLAAMGVSAPDGGWHNDCECTTEPAFNGDTGPSPSVPENDVDAEDTGELGIPEKSWNDTIDFVGNSLSSGKLADADEFLNPDGSVNEAKAIVHLIEQRKSGKPYSLSKSGQPLNKTQTKLLDKFFNKLTGDKPSPVKAADTRVVKSPAEFETTPGDIPSDSRALIDRIDSEQADVEGKIKDAIASGDKGTAATDAQGQVAQTVIKKFNDGSQYISKDVSSKYKNIVRDNTRQIPSEQGASIVARALGLDSPNIVQTGAEQMMMPFYPGGTVIAEGDEERLVADGLQELFGKSAEQDSILGRTGLLDSLIGNTDRNLGNLVRDADGKLIPIDHGESSFKDFNVEGSKLTEAAQSNGVKFSKEDFEAIKSNIEAVRDKIEAIKGPDGYGRQQIGLYMYKGLMRNLTTAMSSYGGWS